MELAQQELSYWQFSLVQRQQSLGNDTEGVDVNFIP